MKLIDELNQVSNQVWAALFVLAGAAPYFRHLDAAGMALVSGGLALMQHKTP